MSNITVVTVAGIPAAFSLNDLGLNITNVGVTPQSNQATTVVTVTVSNGRCKKILSHASHSFSSKHS